ncbi:MAG: hypothetical protein K0U98_09350 [Deltaproteobacteria bacterium]|nr:hypothetical protein [Deltaproteobacteria bacterium]
MIEKDKQGWKEAWGVGLAIYVAGLSVLMCGPQPAKAAEPSFEPAPVLAASEILPADLLKGPHHKVEERVPSDGIMLTFQITSDFGEFSAIGQPLLAERVREVRALAELDRISKTEAFVSAVATSALGQLETIEDFARNPVETVTGLPGGVKRLFRRYQRDLREGYEKAKEVGESVSEAVTEVVTGTGGDKETTEKESSGGLVAGVVEGATDAVESYGKRYFGLTRSEREWYAKLEVDPYTSNRVLRKRIERMARVTAAGNFAVKFVEIPEIPGADVVEKVNRIVWSTDPRKLRDENRKRLGAAGADPELIEKFMANPNLTPSLQTALVAQMIQLDGVRNSDFLVELAAAVESEIQARVFLGSVEILTHYHRGSKSIAEIVPVARIPVARTEQGILAIFVAVDHLSWTEDLAGRSVELLDALSGGTAPKAKELWLGGEASSRFREELESRGWKVNTDGAQPAKS